MTVAPIRVIVADDHAVVREGIRHVLSSADGFEVVGEAGSGREAIALAERCRPHVIVLDISMPHGSGLEIAPELRRVVPDARLLILSIHDHGEYVLQSVRAGAHGYLRKDSTPTELRDAVRALYRGESFFGPAAAAQLAAAVRGEQEARTRSTLLEQLTARERDVLVGIAEGSTNKEIATRHGISPRTVESHRESLMDKLGIRTVAGLTRFAVEQGLIAE